MSLTNQISESIKLNLSKQKKSSVFEYTHKLYPPIQPYKVQRLKVSDIHELYLEESGNPNGIPIVVVHGGPGGCCMDFNRQYFDPNAYRIIMFDQRGSGKSTPHACLQENTTWHLVDDMEKIRELLGIDKWILFGTSWGSTLSLAYAETYPNRCKALILSGIFTCRREELQFLYQKGTSFLFPEYHDALMSMIPEVERGDIIGAYYRRLTGSDEKLKRECAKTWTRYEMATFKLMVNQQLVDSEEGNDDSIAFASLETHYFVNGGFFKEEGQLLKNAHLLKGIPGIIIQGRYDVVCASKTAFDLKKVWNVELVLIPDAGHFMNEPGILSALVQATDQFKFL
eukprot:gene3877-4836_t